MSDFRKHPGFVVPEVYDDGNGPLFEVIEGRRVDRNMWTPMSFATSQIAFEIMGRRKRESLDGWVVTWPFIASQSWHPETRRRPPVAYWLNHQFPNGIAREGDAAVAPALVVEIPTPEEPEAVVRDRVEAYLAAGTAVVWLVDLTARTVRTEQPDGTAHVYRDGDTLVGGPVLPKFKVEVAKLFPKTASSQTGV
ncbi:MAG: Uma2 family endonuclease [Planctomycetota bacterium]